MLRVGLTGGIGSGKTTAGDLFAAAGATVLDADLVAHALTGPGGAAMDAIRATFGAAVVAPDGALDRAAMRALAFSDPGARRRLEAILHPLIRTRMDAQIATATTPVVVAVVPLLVEAGDWRARVDRVLVIDAPREVQIARVMARSRLSREQVMAIIASQASRADRLAAADDVIVNDRGPDDLAAHVTRLYAHYIALATQRSGSA